MNRQHLILSGLCLLSAVLLSIPWLVPHTGALALVGFVPLLCADAIATQTRMRHFWLYALLTFILWNAATTFWVCNATVGGGIFAVVANALQMTLIWVLFRLCCRVLHGPVPYIFLAVMWIAWERKYFDVDISWPWLVLGNAFGRSTQIIQWYEYTGVLGGSLWVWISNLGFFGMTVAAADGHWRRWNDLSRSAAMLAMLLAVAGPVVLSKCMYDAYEEKSEGSVEVLIGQPNFDPYQKFGSFSQDVQNEKLLAIFKEGLGKFPADSTPLLLLAPETFTGDVHLDNLEESPTMQSFREFMAGHPGTEMLFGASTSETGTGTPPSVLARIRPDGRWSISRNSAILAGPGGAADIYHKSKLVVGVEQTPYPKIFVPVDDWLASKLHVSGSLMGRCVGQESPSVLHFDGDIPIGCAICYESVYGEYCTGYVKAGAKAMTVITNDSWWGNTPGYRQHLSYSRLRAIELRRDIARCGNTGISCFIDQRGDILEETPWWEEAFLRGEVNLSSEQTFFVRNGDIVGRVCTLMFLLLALLSIVRAFLPRR